MKNKLLAFLSSIVNLLDRQRKFILNIKGDKYFKEGIGLKRGKKIIEY